MKQWLLMVPVGFAWLKLVPTEEGDWLPLASIQLKKGLW
jgi:hypothetical protein